MVAPSPAGRSADWPQVRWASGGKRSHHAGQRALRSVGVCWGEYRKVLLLLDVHQLRVTQRLLGDHRQVIKVHGLWLLGLVATVTILVFRLG